MPRRTLNEKLDFSGSFPSVERNALIAEAAHELDLSYAHLGPGDEPGTSEAGDIARAFAEDQASLGRPIVHPLDLAQLDAKNMPVTVEELTRKASFYWLEFPVSLYTPRGRAFNELKVKMQFNRDDHGVRPTTFDVLPDQRWAERFQVNAQLSAGVTADLGFVVDAPEAIAALAGAPVGLSAGAEAGAKAGLLLGPFAYTLRVPEVEHTAAKNDHVIWQLKGGSFVKEQDPGLRVLLRVPNEVSVLKIAGKMEATRYFQLLQSTLKGAIKNLPERIKQFFVGGTPIYASGEWDLTSDLA